MPKNEDKIKEIIISTIKEYNKSGAFADRKTTDTPTDAFALVNRRFVTLSSNIGARPTSSVAVTGQRFFDTDNSQPMWFDGNDWVDGVASVVAEGRN